MRIIQTGAGEPRDLIICYLVGAHMDGAIRDALGPAPCVLAYDTGKPADTLDAVVASVRDRLRLARVGRIVLVGYSSGCSGVRERLREEGQASRSLAALVLIDGTHASKPPAAEQLDVWRDAFGRARRGEILVVATHTLQTYVEQLERPQGPFLATVTVLREVTGWPLDDAGPIDAPAGRREGQLWVYSYASGPIDAEAHILQQQKALPMMLRRHVRPWLAGTEPDLPAEEAPPFGADALDLAERAAHNARPGPAPVVRQLLSRGARGEEVVTWQRILGIKADGVFGPETERVTRQWQEKHGLTPDGIVGPISWAAAEADGSPRPPSSCEVPREGTPLSEAELAAVLEQGHRLVFQESPSRARLACAWAHVALENGRGQKIWNNNLGNITAFGKWTGPYYVIRVSERVQRDPDVWKQVSMRFRAHDEALDGAADYWRLMNSRYEPALARFDAGDPEGAAFELSRLRYFTAHADQYARAMLSLYKSCPGRDAG
ncbi:peptidoglycan-binding protein [Sorangium sp. So ce134]